MAPTRCPPFRRTWTADPSGDRGTARAGPTEFRLRRAPVDKGCPGSLGQSPSAARLDRGMSGGSQAGSGRNVLRSSDGIVALVEDGAEDAAAFRRVFSALGDVLVWPTGEAALAAMTGPGPRPHELSMLVVDMGLPGIHGTDVIRTVRALPGGKHAAVFAMSGSTDPGVAERAMAAGADEFIQKPSNLAGLREIANQLAALTADEDEESGRFGAPDLPDATGPSHRSLRGIRAAHPTPTRVDDSCAARQPSRRTRRR